MAKPSTSMLQSSTSTLHSITVFSARSEQGGSAKDSSAEVGAQNRESVVVFVAELRGLGTDTLVKMLDSQYLSFFFFFFPSTEFKTFL